MDAKTFRYSESANEANVEDPEPHPGLSVMMDEEQELFEKELSWCISTLRKSFAKSSPSRNQIKEALKALQILENPKAPMVKKRLAMRNALGDYRAKMLAEEKQIEKKLLQGKGKLAEFSGEKPNQTNGKVLAKAAAVVDNAEATQTFSFDFKV